MLPAIKSRLKNIMLFKELYLYIFAFQKNLNEESTILCLGIKFHHNCICSQY